MPKKNNDGQQTDYYQRFLDIAATDEDTKAACRYFVEVIEAKAKKGGHPVTFIFNMMGIDLAEAELEPDEVSRISHAIIEEEYLRNDCEW